MPSATLLERRDRAVVALIMLAVRDAAVASLAKARSLSDRTLFQDARDVKTKRAKTITTVFFPVGEPFEAVIRDWFEELTRDHLFGPDDPLFPATRVRLGETGFLGPLGLERRPWATAAPVRQIFRRAGVGAGLPYYNPHSLRHTLMRLAYDLNLSHRQMKAWSQNLGREMMLTSFASYGTLKPARAGRGDGRAGRRRLGRQGRCRRARQAARSHGARSSRGLTTSPGLGVISRPVSWRQHRHGDLNLRARIEQPERLERA